VTRLSARKPEESDLRVPVGGILHIKSTSLRVPGPRVQRQKRTNAAP